MVHKCIRWKERRLSNINAGVLTDSFRRKSWMYSEGCSKEGCRFDTSKNNAFEHLDKIKNNGAPHLFSINDYFCFCCYLAVAVFSLLPLYPGPLYRGGRCWRAQVDFESFSLYTFNLFLSLPIGFISCYYFFDLYTNS